MEMEESTEPNSKNAASSQQQESSSMMMLPSHFRNAHAIPAWLRYGMVIYLIGTLTLLIASDIGAGVQAITHTVPDASDNFSILQERVLLTATIFSSVRELWEAESYALSIFIAITSVSWPYVKLLISFYAWMAPIPKIGASRERLLVFLDVFGKWCFVDVVVFIEIMVIFRATIPLGGPMLEVFVVPKWGFFGFVAASMLDLIATHIMVHQHRKVMYPEVRDTENSNEKEKIEKISQTEIKDDDAIDAGTTSVSNSTNSNNAIGLKQLGNLPPYKITTMTVCLTLGIVLYLVGFAIRVFRVQNQRAQFVLDPLDYSLIRTGADLGAAGRDTDAGAVVWLQILWFGLGLVGPILSAVFQGMILWMPWKPAALRTVFTCAEIANAWNSAEVFLVSTIFAVLEVPKFGGGLIDSGCSTCYVVGSQLMPELAVLALGCAFTLIASGLIMRTGYLALYS